MYAFEGEVKTIFALNTAESNDSSNWVSVLNITDMYNTYGGLKYGSSVIVDDFIYTIGAASITFRLNIINDNINDDEYNYTITVEAELPTMADVYHGSAVYVPFLERVYFIGGLTGAGASQETQQTIYYSNYNRTFPTNNPSVYPSFEPSNLPSNVPSTGMSLKHFEQFLVFSFWLFCDHSRAYRCASVAECCEKLILLDWQ